jgi:putative hydrolase of HD superfamily
LIASEEGGDPARAAYLGLWHDSQETRIGDIPHSARPYVETVSNERITEDQTAGLPDNAAKSIRDAVTEYEAAETIEARCAKDADRLECLLQAVDHAESGYKRVDGWIESSRSRLQTPFAHRLAQAALQVSPLTWRNR